MIANARYSGRLTHGTVAEVLSPGAFHPRGVKVRLRDGQVGRVHKINPSVHAADNATSAPAQSNRLTKVQGDGFAHAGEVCCTHVHILT